MLRLQLVSCSGFFASGGKIDGSRTNPGRNIQAICSWRKTVLDVPELSLLAVSASSRARLPLVPRIGTEVRLSPRVGGAGWQAGQPTDLGPRQVVTLVQRRQQPAGNFSTPLCNFGRCFGRLNQFIVDHRRDAKSQQA